MSMCTSSCSLHLTTMGGISDTWSGNCIWKYELISSLQVWVSVCTSSETGGCIWQLIWTLHLKIWTNFHILSLVPVCTSSENRGYIWIWTLHLKILVSVCTSSETGDGGYIWIWILHLKIWVPGRLGVVISEIFSYYIRKTNEWEWIGRLPHPCLKLQSTASIRDKWFEYPHQRQLITTY